MDKTDTPYDKAIDIFEGLVEQPLQKIVSGPLPLARTVGLATTSGYRAVAIAESEGLLSRSTGGAYLRGPSALATGLSALGFGEFALVAEPVLIQLRQSTRLTAFLAVLSDGTCATGPFSSGRGISFITPQRHYSVLMPPAFDPDGLAEISLAHQFEAVAAQRAVISCVSERRSKRCIVGVLLPGTREVTGNELRSELAKAADLLCSHSETPA
ncbi:hypothetical protein ABVF61_27700 [Roseibium sp. HPY-6]|uniref:hypothetical protein n=1 Tax=Roseibium sp. HPY-6 TaxID=3229852 RepID=UPI00338F1FC9